MENKKLKYVEPSSLFDATPCAVNHLNAKRIV